LKKGGEMKVDLDDAKLETDTESHPSYRHPSLPKAREKKTRKKCPIRCHGVRGRIEKNGRRRIV